MILGDNNTIGPYCYIANAKIGNGNHFVSHVCIGTPAQHRNDVDQGLVHIGNNNTIHEFSQVHRSTHLDAPTKIGDHCLLMTNSHIAHDCILENNVTTCSNTTLGGHTYIMKNATLGFSTVTHQWQVIGSFVQTGMGTICPKHASIKPGYVFAGNPAECLKPNTIGLERNDVTDVQLKQEQERFELLEVGWSNRKAPSSHRDPKLLGPLAVKTILDDYAKTRDRKYNDIKWNVCDSAVALFKQVDWTTFAELYDGVFSLLWQQMDDFKNTQFEIRKRLIEPARRFFQPDPLPGGDRVGWLIRNLSVGMYAPYKHVRAFIEGQVRNGIKPIVYCYGPVDAAEAQTLEKLGITVRQSIDPAELRAFIEMDQVGTLIADSYAAHVLTLFEMRSAPVQFYLSPGFQLFPADAVLVPPTQNKWADKIIEVPSPMLWEHLYREAEPVAKPGKIVFGVLGRYEKINEEYLSTVKTILDKVAKKFFDEAVFCAWGRGSLVYSDQRIQRMGYADPHTVLPNIDVYLDTFPTCGGISVWEAMAHRVPVVTRGADDAWNSWNAVKPHVVETKEEYINKAIALLIKPETDRGYAQARAFADIDAAGRQLNGIIEQWRSPITVN